MLKNLKIRPSLFGDVDKTLMFYPETVEPASLELVRKLQQMQGFKDFLLVGGTALSLQLGHRKSVVIDLSSQQHFQAETCATLLEENYDFQLLYLQSNTLKGIIGEIFIDIVTHNYPLISDVVLFEGIRMASLQDIAAMKVNAISGTGTRIKDFIDIYFLLKTMSFQAIIESFKKKYGARNEFHAIKSLTYFDGVDLQTWPEMILEPELRFQEIKNSIIEAQNAFLGSH
jgi:hypothetical protein